MAWWSMELGAYRSHDHGTAALGDLEYPKLRAKWGGAEERRFHARRVAGLRREGF
jgi:hypothetical protein